MKKKILEEINLNIIKALEEGTCPWRNPFIPQMSGDGHVYRGINRLVLNMKCKDKEYKQPTWFTFNSARKKGGRVMKGEKGTRIIYGGVGTRKDKDDNDIFFQVFKTWHVFNVEQIDWEDEAPTQEMAQEEPIDLVRKYLVSQNIKLTDIPGSAYYAIKEDRINVPNRSALVSEDSYYPIMFHEMGHSTGAADRLNRSGIAEISLRDEHTYSEEELVAEMISAYLCGTTGLQLDHLDQSAAYIKGWLGHIKNDPDVLMRAISEAEKGFQFITKGEVDEDLTTGKEEQ